MNVLHLALVSECNDGPIDRGFVACGHEVRRIDWRAEGHASNARARDLAQWADLCFFQGQGTNTIEPATLDHLRANGVFVANWTGDVRDDVEWYAAMAPHVDITLFTNRTDVETMRALGHRSDFVQVGYDETIYKYRVNEQRSGVVFLGNHYPGRFPETDSRMRMVDAMRSAFPKDFRMFGKNWPKSWGIQRANPHEEVKQYHRALVAINFDHYHRPGFASDRLLRATACGCATVSQYYEGIEAEHPYVGAAHSIDDMIRMVGYALRNPEQSKVVGEQAAQWTKDHHQWTERIKQITAWMG